VTTNATDAHFLQSKKIYELHSRPDNALTTTTTTTTTNVVVVDDDGDDDEQ